MQPVLRDTQSLFGLISGRLIAAGATPDSYLRDAVEIVVFGSVAAGLDRADSDIDVLCVGCREGKVKTERLDLMSIPQAKAEDPNWLGSELAGHIFQYGIWIRGTPQLARFTTISEECVETKRRRVAAFMRRLPEAWDELDPDFKIKYAIKVRREMQRLMLLESEVVVPPTRLLDSSPPDAPVRAIVCDRLRRLVSDKHRQFCRPFLNLVMQQWVANY